jgi:hypothetical protein
MQQKKHFTNASLVVVFLTTLAAVLLASASGGLFSEGAGLDALKVFAQEQNQTTAASGNNNTNLTTTAAATEAASNYNEMLNPRQKEYPAHLGFNDLHIEAIRHIDPNATKGSQQQDIFNLIVHHHCKVYDDMSATCLLFPTGMNDQDKLYGIEYVIPANQYNTLPEEGKKYWHYHLTELPRVNATLPDMTAEKAAKV